MTPTRRAMRFALVGALGFGVQLGTVAMLHPLFRGWPLLISVVALQVTLLHNYAWHRHLTWADRQTGFGAWLRFQLANGAVSLTGTLVLVELLTRGAHLPLLPANLLTISCCSLVNFRLADRWAFRLDGSRNGPELRRCGLLAGALLVTLSSGAQAQSGSAERGLPDLPPAPAVQVNGKTGHLTGTVARNESFLLNAGVLCGSGASTSPAGTVPTAGCGAGITFLPLPLFFEVGVMGPQANRSKVSSYLSVDARIPLAGASARALPMLLAGYSRLFETGHALDYGVALALPIPGHPEDSTRSLRLELRDYYTFANPAQHNVMLRVGWMSVVTD